MNTSQFARLCACYRLGELVGEPQEVAGGLLHQMWRLATTDGVFAVKQLNPAVMGRQGIRDAYRLTEQIATAMAAHGIPAVASLHCQGDPLLEIDEITVIVYRWIDGEILPVGPVEPELARLMGKLLGRMHTLRLQLPALQPPIWEPFLDDEWDMLTYHAADRSLPWAYQIRAALPKLSEWSRASEEAGKRLNETLVVSHRDLDQKNVLWQDTSSPMLIDWEAAGLINPTMELVGVALNWSGQTVGPPREDIFHAVFEGYIDAGGTVQAEGRDALHGCMDTWLGWLLFNMHRSFGEATSTEEERLLGIRETAQTLTILRSLAANVETWANWVDQWR